MPISTPSLELLETFWAVAESGSVSAAARLLHRSQPAISERLQRLNDIVGEALYVPNGRGIRLTAAGEAYLTPARRLLELKNEVSDMLYRRSHLQEGVLKIAATNTIANYFLPQHLVEFRQVYPEVEIIMKGGVSDWSQTALLDWDLLFIEEGSEDVSLPRYYRKYPWLQDEILTIFPNDHPLASQPDITIADLLAFPMVWRESQSGVRARVLQEFTRQGLSVPIRIEVNGVEAMGNAVAAGLGIGFIASTALRYRSDWEFCTRRLPAPQGIHWTLYLAVPEAPYRSYTLTRFLQHIGLEQVADV
ncbi:LysR family transcriptional regulator [Acidithiobacillus sp. IBUN Pt1247-S3]|uniref:LysR family transcriptional regulator n=1 Tax=Acidithiobacillus sp. IBUN Pt1247-S3 TaxID=3166642 RepID=UPI0034E46AEF